MTNLVATLAAVLHATVPSVSVDRVNAIAADMVSVVEAEHTSDKRLDSASSLAMLAAVAIHESGLRESVENCKAAGDGGKSIGLGQVMRGPNWEGHTRQEICSSRKLQLQLALHTIDRCNTKGRSMESVFRCYTSGNPSFDSAAARSEHKLFLNLRSSIRETAKRNEKLEASTKADRSVEVPGA